MPEWCDMSRQALSDVIGVEANRLVYKPLIAHGKVTRISYTEDGEVTLTLEHGSTSCELNPDDLPRLRRLAQERRISMVPGEGHRQPKGW